jgi:hypothetical protein
MSTTSRRAKRHSLDSSWTVTLAEGQLVEGVVLVAAEEPAR